MQSFHHIFCNALNKPNITINNYCDIVSTQIIHNNTDCASPLGPTTSARKYHSSMRSSMWTNHLPIYESRSYLTNNYNATISSQLVNTVTLPMHSDDDTKQLPIQNTTTQIFTNLQNFIWHNPTISLIPPIHSLYSHYYPFHTHTLTPTIQS